MLVEMFDTVSGVNKATMGKQEPNVTSGVQAQVYRNASTSKIDFKARQLDASMQVLGSMWIAMIKNLGTEMHNMEMKEGEETADVRYIGQEFMDTDTMVRARVGSMMPDNHAYIEEKLLSLAQMGLINDPEYILEHMQIPGVERLINNMRKNNQGLNPEQFAGMSEDEIFQQLKQNPQMAQQVNPNQIKKEG
tara:strand:- start:1615 stop:2190 length:576 start_codon:yes stop_codon:yes gene_type:complete